MPRPPSGAHCQEKPENQEAIMNTPYSAVRTEIGAFELALLQAADELHRSQPRDRGVRRRRRRERRE
jgi:hypothetical protein